MPVIHRDFFDQVAGFINTRPKDGFKCFKYPLEYFKEIFPKISENEAIANTTKALGGAISAFVIPEFVRDVNIFKNSLFDKKVSWSSLIADASNVVNKVSKLGEWIIKLTAKTISAATFSYLGLITGISMMVGFTNIIWITLEKIATEFNDDTQKLNLWKLLRRKLELLE